MAVDINRINNIEYNLKLNLVQNISTNDLIYYLEYNTHNTNISSSDLKLTENYFKKINASFYFEDIFVNKTNYTSFLLLIFGLLLPFYYTYPKFYKLGSGLTILGIVSYLSIYFKLNSLYSNFFKNVGLYFLISTLIFYIVFFIFLNKLNHISLFFISGLIIYFFLTNVCKIILSFPIESNPYNKYRATINNNKNFVPYNLLIETTCLELLKRFNLNLPSGNMLYSYLTEFQIGDNNEKYSDFFTNFFGPILSVGLLWLLSKFLNDVKGEMTGLSNSGNKNIDINFFPITGFDDISLKYIMCGANFILPKHLNCDLMIKDLLDKYKSEIFNKEIKDKKDINNLKYEFDDEMYNKLQKSFLRISNELLEKYNPKFSKKTFKDKEALKEEIYKNISVNKSYLKIQKIFDNDSECKKEFAQLKFTKDYEDVIKNFANKKQGENKISYQDLVEIYSALGQINNCLTVEDFANEKYQNLSNLAIQTLLGDEKLKGPVEILFKKIAEEFKTTFVKNLEAKNIYGYDDNIISYNYFQNLKEKSNSIFGIIIRLISTWFLFAKPFGSSWLLTKYFLIPSYGFEDIIKNISNGNFIWKYISLGLDSEYFKDKIKSIKISNNETIFQKISDIVLSIIVFLISFSLLQFYNTSSFGFNLSPGWHNLICQIIFFGNIIGNMIIYKEKKSNIWFNFIYFGIVLIIIIIITILVLLIKK